MERTNFIKSRKGHNKLQNTFVVCSWNQGSAPRRQVRVTADSRHQGPVEEQSVKPEPSVQPEPSVLTMSSNQDERADARSVEEVACQPEKQVKPKPVNPWKIGTADQVDLLQLKEKDFPSLGRELPKDQAEVESDLNIIPQETSEPLQEKNHLDKYLEDTKQCLLQIPELELHNLMGHKQRADQLEKEKAALLYQMEQLKKQLQAQRARPNPKIGVLLNDLFEKREAEKRALLRAKLFEEDLVMERRMRLQVERHLNEKEKEVSALKAALAQKDLGNQKHQQEEDQGGSITEQEQASLDLGFESDLTEVKDEQVHQEKEAVEDQGDQITEHGPATLGFESEKEAAEENEPTIQTQDIKKKNKKKSLWKRFVCVFRKSRRSEPSATNI